MIIWLAVIAFALFLLAMKRYQFPPIWPAGTYALVFFGLLCIERRQTMVSNSVGALAAGGFAFLVFAAMLKSRIWILVLATFLVPAGAMTVANRVRSFIAAL